MVDVHRNESTFLLHDHSIKSTNQTIPNIQSHYRIEEHDTTQFTHLILSSFFEYKITLQK